MDAKLTRRDAMQWAGAAVAVPASQYLSNYAENGWMPFTPKFADLVRNVATVTGTGPVTPGPAVNGFISLVAAVSTGEQFYYCIQGIDKPAEREVGRGTMQADGKVARQAIAGNLTNFTTGAKTIALVTPAEWFARLDGAMISAANRAELAGKDGAATGRAYLAEPNRAGTFLFNGSDLSAKVAADNRQGIHVAPASDPTGASGAWVRSFDGAVNIRWFGASGDGETDDGPAFLAALATLKALAVNQTSSVWQASASLYVPPGHYFLGTSTLDLTHTLTIEGAGHGRQAGGYASLLRWAPGTTGIRVQGPNTTGASGTIASGFNGGSGSTIRGLRLFGAFPASGFVEGEHHGIHLRAVATIEDCTITQFQGDGIYSNAVAGGGGAQEGNANTALIKDTTVTWCRTGLFVDGADTNAWLIQGLDITANRTWGIWDSSFLGNCYIGCHSAANGWDGALNSNPTACVHGGNRYYVKEGQALWCRTNAPTGTTTDNQGWGFIAAGSPYSGVVAWASGTNFREGGSYKTDNSNANNLFLGCYSEGDQNPAQFQYPTLAVSGLHGAGFKGTGVQLVNSFGVVSAFNGGGLGSRKGNDFVQMFPGYLEFGNSAGFGTIALEWMGPALACTFDHSGDVATMPFFITAVGTANDIGPRRMNFPSGFGLGSKKVLSGNAAPSSGSHKRGDMMFHSSPTAGGPMGWMCVADGTPGTWTAMANLAS